MRTQKRPRQRSRLTLQDARKQCDITIDELAHALRGKVHKATLYRIEAGAVRPLHEHIEDIEDALKLPHGTLLVPRREVAAS